MASDGVVGSVVDLLLASVGLADLLYPVAGAANALLGGAVATSAVSVAVGVASLGGAYPFVVGDRSLGRLGTYLLTVTGIAVAGGLLWSGAATLAGRDSGGEGPLLRAVAAGAAYAAAYLLVYRGGWATVTARFDAE